MHRPIAVLGSGSVNLRLRSTDELDVTRLSSKEVDSVSSAAGKVTVVLTSYRHQLTGISTFTEDKGHKYSLSIKRQILRYCVEKVDFNRRALSNVCVACLL